MYGHLYPNDGSKIVARSTTQDRMTQSAEYFLAGFFGLQWPTNASLELVIEQYGFNNSMAGYVLARRHLYGDMNLIISRYYGCPQSNKSTAGNTALAEWASVYLADATARLAPLAPGLNLNVTDVYNMQSLCAYETVGLGYSEFCSLFTFEEWQGYEYSVDINFAGYVFKAKILVPCC
jgi:hypothetical protein